MLQHIITNIDPVSFSLVGAYAALLFLSPSFLARMKRFIVRKKNDYKHNRNSKDKKS